MPNPLDGKPEPRFGHALGRDESTRQGIEAMSAALRMVHGVTHHEPARARAGYTLFAPMYGRNVWLIDMWGAIVQRWRTDNLPGNYGELLPNGNLMFAGRILPAAIPEFAGNGGQIVELDWDGEAVWEYRDPHLSHCFAPLRNGNLLVAKWRAVPREIARRVRGGQPGTELRGEMYGEAVQEIDRDGAVVWEWLTFEHLDPEGDAIGPFHPRDRWTNLNSLAEMPDGRILVSFRCIDTIAIVDRKTGNIDWRWGPGTIAGQHHPTWLDNGNVLVFDNGAHRRYTTIDFSRVLEVDPRTDTIAWEYKENPVHDFNSFICSGAQRLDNGNTLICESTRGRLFEVTREGDIVWEFASPFYYEHPVFGTNNMIFRCFRYDESHPGIAEADLDPGRYEDFNALMPRRFVRSPRGNEALAASYATGALVRGGH